MVRLLDTLVAKGLIERSKDAGDRRAKLLSLTPEGLLVVARIQKTVRDLDSELLTPFTAGEITQLANFVLRLETSVRAVHQRCKR